MPKQYFPPVCLSYDTSKFWVGLQKQFMKWVRGCPSGPRIVLLSASCPNMTKNHLLPFFKVWTNNYVLMHFIGVCVLCESLCITKMLYTNLRKSGQKVAKFSVRYLFLCILYNLGDYFKNALQYSGYQFQPFSLWSCQQVRDSFQTHKGVTCVWMYVFPTNGIIQKFRLIKHACFEPNKAPCSIL